MTQVYVMGKTAMIKYCIYLGSVYGCIGRIILSQWRALQHDLIRCIEAAHGLDLVRVKVISPVSQFVQSSLGAWFAATVAHEQNHIAQAQRVRQDPHFP